MHVVSPKATSLMWFVEEAYSVKKRGKGLATRYSLTSGSTTTALVQVLLALIMSCG